MLSNKAHFTDSVSSTAHLTTVDSMDNVDTSSSSSFKSDAKLIPWIDPDLSGLRDYQRNMFLEIQRTYATGVRSLVAVAPTGSGKTIVFTKIVTQAAALGLGERILILAPKQEIFEQICDALEAMGVTHGKITAIARDKKTLDAPAIDYPIQVAMVGTLSQKRRLREWAGRFDLIVVDEAHHAVAGSWSKIFAAMPNARILGVTATPERLDGRGLGDVFDAMVRGPSIAALIKNGSLCKYRLYTPATRPDLSQVRTIVGDFALDELSAVMNKGVIIESAVREYLQNCPGTPSIAFCVDIAHSQAVAECFLAYGVRAAHIDGTTPGDVRRDLIASLGDGRLDVLCNCGLISEGVDVPNVGAVLMLRPTRSIVLHRQQAGRALRLAPGKIEAFILDFVWNFERHPDLLEEPDWRLIKHKGKEKKQSIASLRRCEGCGTINAHDAQFCAHCGADILTRKEREEIIIQLQEYRRVDDLENMRIVQQLSRELEDALWREEQREKQARLLESIRRDEEDKKQARVEHLRVQKELRRINEDKKKNQAEFARRLLKLTCNTILNPPSEEAERKTTVFQINELAEFVFERKAISHWKKPQSKFCGDTVLQAAARTTESLILFAEMVEKAIWDDSENKLKES